MRNKEWSDAEERVGRSCEVEVLRKGSVQPHGDGCDWADGTDARREF